MTDTPANTIVTTATGVAQTVETTVKADATAEVTSLSTHWHVPVWAVLVILGVGAWAVLHFVL
jgi:hypothetical protein